MLFEYNSLDVTLRASEVSYCGRDIPSISFSFILLLRYRGQLAQTLKKIRQISDKQLRYERESSLSQRSQPLSSLLFSNTRNPPPPHHVHLDDDNDNTDHLKEEAKVEGQQSNTSELSGGEIVMRNFRELLWYWSEYYLRRGRDRLSIEFSCHIPFSYWYALVSKYRSPSLPIFFEIFMVFVVRLFVCG